AHAGPDQRLLVLAQQRGMEEDVVATFVGSHEAVTTDPVKTNNSAFAHERLIPSTPPPTHPSRKPRLHTKVLCCARRSIIRRAPHPAQPYRGGEGHAGRNRLPCPVPEAGSTGRS